jgi:uncharacterized protein
MRLPGKKQSGHRFIFRETTAAAMERNADRDAILHVLATHMEEVRDRFGVRSLALFGSVARGEGRPDSDVDILVEFGRPAGYFTLVDLQLYLEELLSRPVDVVTPAGLKSRHRPGVVREAVHVW